MTRTWSTLVIVVCIACTLAIAGCGTGGSDSGTSWYGGGDGVDYTTTPQITAVNNMDLPGQPVRVGDWIQIQGSGFGAAKPGTTSEGYVAFSDGTTVTKATSYGQWTDTLVECQVPQGAPIKASIFKESVSIYVVKADTTEGGSSYNSNANPTPSPSPTSGGGGGGGVAAPTLVSVTVTPESAVIGHKKGPSEMGFDYGGAATQEFTAKANYSNGSEVDVTTTCTWTTTSTVGEIGGATGKFTADDMKKYIEQAEVKAAYGGKEGTAKITVGLVDVPGAKIAAESTPLNNVIISEFYAGQYEVTNKDYCEFLNDQKNKVESSGGETWWFSQGNAPNKYNGISDNGSGVYTVVNNYDARPVVYVSWYGAVAFCNWLTEKHGIKKDDGTYDYCYGEWSTTGALRWTSDGGTDGDNYHPENKGYRLATETEWEYACRINDNIGGVSTTDYYWGENNPSANIALYCLYSQLNHQDVGLFKPNGLGLFDMSGNVWEWVSDWYLGTGVFPNNGFGAPHTDSNNPLGPLSDSLNYRLLRGGCWGIDANHCRSGFRDYGDPGNRTLAIGFRLVRTK